MVAMCEISVDMRKRFKTAQTLPAFLAALLLVLASSSHIHLRYCLDGDEAPISIHFETEDSHATSVDIANNIDESDKADIESELSLDTLLSKLSKSEIDSVAIPSIYVAEIQSESLISFALFGHQILPISRTTLLPPSRAPPAIA